MRHAEFMNDPFTQAQLRKLASEFLVRALEFESKETASVGR